VAPAPPLSPPASMRGAERCASRPSDSSSRATLVVRPHGRAGAVRDPDGPRSSRRRHRLDAVACLSLSTLCFSQARSESLFYTNWGFYHQLPLGALALFALVLNIAALAAVGFLCGQAIRCLQRPTWRRRRRRGRRSAPDLAELRASPTSASVPSRTRSAAPCYWCSSSWRWRPRSAGLVQPCM
jgi:hypothetical protein